MSGSVTLVDAMVVISGHQQSWFEPLARAVPLGVAAQVVREAAFYVLDDGTEVPIDLGGLIGENVLRLEHATLEELASFARACRRSGLGSGEIESLSLVMARGHDFCTGDVRAMRAMADLGLASKWRALEDLMEAAHLATTGLGPEYRRDAWPVRA